MANQKGKISDKIFLSPPWMGGTEREWVDESFASNYIAPCGPMVDRFEREFARKVGVPHACALSSCTAALDLLFHELGVSPDDTVFCSDLTFVASIAPAVQRGAEPVFIDCNTATWTMDPDLLEEALADAAAKNHLPKAVVAVDLYGQCCEYDRLEMICKRYNVPLIIDAAEALGAVYGNERLAMGNGQSQEEKGRCAGDAGWAAVYSFNGNKIITTSGGGMLASRDKRLVERMRWLSQQARENCPWYEHRALGYNYRMSNIVAAIGVGQLTCLDKIIDRKRSIFNRYRNALRDIEGLSFMPEAPYGICTRWLTVIEISLKVEKQVTGGRKAGTGKPAEQVMRVIEALERENIESRPVWKPMHMQPVFEYAKMYGSRNSEEIFRRGICLPSGAGLSDADVDRVTQIVRNALAKK